ncbi:tannase/feruloyl esterase family alpha/beta hydrolase [Shewanella psychrotolerans]|uniref:tannase/feruloyl esterase family alpha/beta hydrolase n=1 Tax=Shewanella psychrotolerans TaxID=2864206 RepID=UPI001C65962D|nr:tannase/feruloyl esterase family alpha/beta hydrolase [Shewanella psychrotolerans]QYK01139.1 tannase/feruloyl esterase family alpha/beta hydrolase [Shewanella psychrotolerans]
MKTKTKWLPLIVTPLCITLYGCNSSSSDHKSQPDVEAATPGNLNLCHELAEQFNYSETKIVSAELLPEGSNTVQSPTPAHCVVTGAMNERVSLIDNQTYKIGFEMRLPVDWNGRFYYQANGGFDGVVKQAIGQFLSVEDESQSALNKGFAVISSDAGHPSPAPTFGLDPQARLDYGYNAVATLTPMAKSLIEKAYGKQPDHSYFAGCSNGGRHTMVASARFADMYDGFLVGNPGFNLPKSAISQIYGIQQYATLVDVDPENVLGSLQSGFTQQEYALVSEKVLQQCDALDGASDGMVNDLAGCQEAFDLYRDVPSCVTERDGTCLTNAQKDVLNNIMSGPHNSITNEAIYSNFPYDAGMGTSDYYGWEFFMAMMFDSGSVSYVFSTPPTPFDGSTDMGKLEYINSFNIDTDVGRIYAIDENFTESSVDFMTPPNATDLSTLRDRGAKMMVVHGSSDSVFSPADTINWYEGLQDANGRNADEFARLYLVPGMNHCGNGPSTDRFEMLDKLVDWVEQGMQPQSIEASVRPDNAELPSNWSPTRTRPLCPYPQVATYNGTGNIEDAASFSCVAPK